MPNIEIYGKRFRINALKKDETELNSLVDKIIGVMKKIGKEDDAVITIIESQVITCNHGGDMPFIRVCSIDRSEIGNIVKAFKKAKIGMDIETLFLERFITADTMK